MRTLLYCRLAFLHGDHGDQTNFIRIQEALDNGRTDQAEIGLCKKNRLSRILQIARIAKSKQQFNQIETKDLHKTTTSASSNFTQCYEANGRIVSLELLVLELSISPLCI
ncbi:hypothetical protein ANCDUO_08300 [Ancylostoma duodenale]|uniref:Uncharacterized protein n=1 Tax=Ancylostoma duodenale TaxID=51022 RepID=A0A0C2DG65_9BILA|nr:hypothetical protein ANCDUO_08300 [Ancylostoma duodenale]